jgi:hypothetical protein
MALLQLKQVEAVLGHFLRLLREQLNGPTQFPRLSLGLVLRPSALKFEDVSSFQLQS